MKKKLFVTLIAAIVVMVFAQQGVTMADYALPRITSFEPIQFTALNK